MTSMRRLVLLITIPAIFGSAAVLPATAGALGLPTTFPRTIVITGIKQQVRVDRFQVATKSQGTRMRVTVKVGATSLGGSRRLLIGVAPCSGGTLTSPSCVPHATSALTLGTNRVNVQRSFLVPRPASRPDAVRVTLTVGTSVRSIPYKTSNVGGGGGTAEILLNGGTWRFQQGTFWGMVAAPPAGFSVDRVWFNSRRYEWAGAASGAAEATTSF